MMSLRTLKKQLSKIVILEILITERIRDTLFFGSLQNYQRCLLNLAKRRRIEGFYRRFRDVQ